MTKPWCELFEELDQWERAGNRATLWWRDDDAVDPSAKLDGLLRATDGIPLALAVIPVLTGPPLARRLAGLSRIAVFQHGWRHADHSAGGGPSEYPEHRPDGEVADELARGRDRLVSLFGDQAPAAFAPPWHGFDDRFLPLLATCGLRLISRMGRRPAAHVGDVGQLNVHVPLTHWSNPPSFRGEDAALAEIANHLRARRLGRADSDEPTGILTHHRAHDDATERFIAHLITAVTSHPAVAWVDSRNLIDPGFPARV